MGIKDSIRSCSFVYSCVRLFWKRIYKIFLLFEAAYVKIKIRLLDRKDFLLSSNFTSLDEFKNHLSTGQFPKIFLGNKDGNTLIRLFSDKYKSDIETRAQNLIAHEFEIFGNTISFDDEIEWHLDFQSKYKWPLRYYKRLLPVFNTNDETDAKFPYELSRFTHFTTLGIAYKLSGDEKFVQEFVTEIDSWIDKNPYLHGVNWTCAMDVAIRACNLITGYCFIKNSNVLSDDFISRFFKYLYLHGEFVSNNLEYHDGMTTNHYLSNITGLVYLGVMFSHFRDAKEWISFGIQELKKEIMKQVYPDGCDFEASTCYHRLALELFFFSTFLIVINDRDFNGNNFISVSNKILKMMDI